MIKLNSGRLKIASLRKASNTKLAGMPGMSGFGGSGGYGSSGAGSTGSSGSGFGNNGGKYNQNRFNPVYDDLSEGTIIEQFMPVDPRRLHRIWRRIYLQDPVAGPAVDLYRDIPWSDFQLTNINDKEIEHFYTDALNAINCVALLPQIAGEHLIMGKVIGALHMDDSKGYPTRVIIHDPDWIRVTTIPIPGFQPKLDIIPTPEMRAWASSKDERDVNAQQQVQWLADMIKSGKEVPLAEDNSFYITRKTSPSDNVGASIYTRILMFVAYEKALVNSTIAATKRRMSEIRHITMGIDGEWSPIQDEMDAMTSLFMQADEDPVGAIVATRTGVTIAPVGGGTLKDIVKISDEWAFLSAGKLNSLGIAESLISGEGTISTTEQTLSIFLDRIKAQRDFFTHELIINKFLKPLAVKHGFVKRTTAELNHKIRVAKHHTNEDYVLPTVVYSKNLRPVADKDYLEILGIMEEKGIPVTVKTWAASAGFDLDNEVEQFEDDLERRKQMAAHKKKISEVAPEAAGQPGSPGGMGGLGGGGGLGEMGGGLGGGMGDLGELPMGGAEGGEEPFELPTAASVRKASVDANANLSMGPHWRSGNTSCISKEQEDVVIDNDVGEKVDALPYWEKGSSFLGVEKESIKKYASSVLNKIGKDGSKVLSDKDLDCIKTGHNGRDQVVKYMLGRLGILHGFSLSKDVVDDLVDELCKLDNKRAIAAELQYVYGFSISSPVKSNENRVKLSKVIPKVGVIDNALLTGYTDTTKSSTHL